MKPSDIYTSRIWGMDYRVWLVVLFTWLISLTLFGYKQINKTSCIDAAILVNGKLDEGLTIYPINRLIEFKLQIDTTAVVKWNYDDGSEEISRHAVYHQFTKEGNYMITAKVNGRCKLRQEITVKKPVGLDEQEKIKVEIFPDPLHPKVGDSIHFYGVSNVQADSYEWSIIGVNAPVQNKPVATFAFNFPAKYTIQLRINNDPSKYVRKVIEVFDLTTQVPEGSDLGNSNLGVPGSGGAGNVGPPPELFPPGEHTSGKPSNHQVDKDALGGQKPSGAETRQADAPKIVNSKVVDIDPNTFMSMLQEVIDEAKEVEDLYTYLDYKGSTKVQVNDKPALINLPVFCKNMRNEKNNRIEALTFKRDDKKSIQTIQVKIKEKKGLFSRIFN